jgi:hypothetical protein
VCIAGSLVGLADAVRLVLLGRPLTSGLLQLDSATDVATAVGALGGLCGVLGLMALRATGNNPIFRLLGYLPGVAYVAALIGSLGLLVGVLTSSDNDPVSVLIWVVADLLGPAAWLAVAILTVAAKRVQGWRRFVPFAIVLAFALGIAVSSITGLAGTFRIVEYAALMLLGYAVQSAASAPRLREALA